MNDVSYASSSEDGVLSIA